VNNQELVSLVREPHNGYDPNAVKVNNVNGVQVGHIKRELAKSLATIIDRRLARVEGSVMTITSFVVFRHDGWILCLQQYLELRLRVVIARLLSVTVCVQ